MNLNCDEHLSHFFMYYIHRSIPDQRYLMYLLMSTNFLKQRACEKQEKQKNPTVDDLKIFQNKILWIGVSTKSSLGRHFKNLRTRRFLSVYFLFYAICCQETVHNKCCINESVRKAENDKRQFCQTLTRPCLNNPSMCFWLHFILGIKTYSCIIIYFQPPRPTLLLKYIIQNKTINK